MLYCKKCDTHKPQECFSKSKHTKNGYIYTCKQCKKFYNDANRLKHKAVKRAWRQNNKGAVLAHKAAGRARKLQASPSWVTPEEKEEIKKLYKKAQERGLHVDHIVPLKGINVSGLHVLSNLQLLTPTENLSKGNRY